MSLRLHDTPAAARDMIDHYKYIAAEQPAAADRFYDAVERTFQGLLQFPLSGRAVEVDDRRVGGLRRLGVPGFRNFVILYRVSAEAIEIVRVVHGARHLPGLPLD